MPASVEEGSCNSLRESVIRHHGGGEASAAGSSTGSASLVVTAPSESVPGPGLPVLGDQPSGAVTEGAGAAAAGTVTEGPGNREMSQAGHRPLTPPDTPPLVPAPEAVGAEENGVPGHHPGVGVGDVLPGDEQRGGDHPEPNDGNRGGEESAGGSDDDGRSSGTVSSGGETDRDSDSGEEEGEKGYGSKKVKLGTVFFSDLVQGFVNYWNNSGPRNYSQEMLNFSQLQCYDMKPDDDFEDKIYRYAKVRLIAGFTYNLKKTVFITNDCYIIGSGATVVFSAGINGPGFVINKRRMQPSIQGMTGVTFNGIRFENTSGYTGNFITTTRYLLVHDCYFGGFAGTVLNITQRVDIRGTHFEGCSRVVVSESPAAMVCMQHSLMTRCGIGIVARGDVKLIQNTSSETFCFAVVHGEGKVCHNTVMNPFSLSKVAEKSFLTCGTGEYVPLRAFHVVSNRKKKWPTMICNNFSRASIFLGDRRGVLYLKKCSLWNTSVYVETPSVSRVVFGTAFIRGGTVYKVLKTFHREGKSTECACGSHHPMHVRTCGDVTQKVLPDPLVFSCDSVDFSSTESEGGHARK